MMKPSLEFADKQGEAAVKASATQRFRRLKWNELVSRGDFVEDGNLGFEPWEGPSGFRADAFVKAIFRRTRAIRPQPKG